MVIPLMICGLMLFCVVFFGIHQFQRHQMRWTRSSLEQREAFFLADAALSRGVARYMALPYPDRWYGPNPVDNLLTGVKHSGLFDHNSGSQDDGGAPLNPRAAYTVLAEDRHDGEREGLPLTIETNLDYTELFAHATVPGYGGPVSVLVYGRLATCPEVGYLNPDPTGPERVKKVIRYRVFTAPEYATGPYRTPGADTAAVRSQFEWEIARAHQNFLRNRLTFKDLRAKVDAAWNKPAAPAATYTDAAVEALFAGITPPAANPYDSVAPAAVNWFASSMFRNYRLSDTPPAPPQGLRFCVDPAKVHDARTEQIITNIMLLFSGLTLKPMPDWTRLDSPTPLNTGDKFMNRVLKSGQTADDVITEASATWADDVGSFWRDEEKASIIPGHAFPFPTPTGPFSDPETGTKYVDGFFLDAFASATPPTIAAMQAEAVRINPFLPGDKQIDPNEVRGLGISPVAYPILMYSQLNDGSKLVDNPLSIPELITYFGKHIEAPQAPFIADGPSDPGPAIPPPDPRPPKEGPEAAPPVTPAAPQQTGGYVGPKIIP